MTQPGIEPQSPGLLADTLSNRSKHFVPVIKISKNLDCILQYLWDSIVRNNRKNYYSFEKKLKDS